jgi:hypothetical protein
MLVVVLVYQQVENNILTPKIQGKAVELSGFFIIVAVTLFGALLGVLGALTGRAARGDDPDLHPGADEGAAREGRRGEGRAASGGGGAARLGVDAHGLRGEPDRRPEEHACTPSRRAPVEIVRREPRAQRGEEERDGEETTASM